MFLWTYEIKLFVIDFQMNPPVHPADTAFINNYAALAILLTGFVAADDRAPLLSPTV